MGDMKTPDFDDLLAAFDIPDMVDPKAAIESGHHDDHDNQLKQASGGVSANDDEAQNPSAGHDVGVSVIVKNIRNMDTGEHGGNLSEKEGHLQPQPHAVTIGNGLHNGFLPATSPSKHYTKNGWKAPREEGHPVNNPTSTFNQFSPISSAEEFDDDDKIEVDDPLDKQSNQSFFRPTPNSMIGHPSCPRREDQNPNPPKSLESVSEPRVIGDSGRPKPDQNNNNGTFSCAKVNDTAKSRKPDEQAKESVTRVQGQVGKESGELSALGSVAVSGSTQTKTKSSAKLSSCIAAIAALSARKASTEDSEALDSPTSQKEPIPVSPLREFPQEVKENPRTSEQPHEQESALEVAKRLLLREPDSPSSVISEGSSKGSPASPTGTTPVIPKVRIKTIKTSSGQIKRTVTRVLPEFDHESLKKGENSNIPSVMVSSMLSSPTSAANFSSPTRHSIPTTVVATSGGPSMEITKQMTIKPVATAFLPVSAVKTAGSQVINLKLANNTTVKATVIPAASVQSASSAILKAANTIQQQTVMVPASSLANAKLVPKTVHLTNLNLLPQTVSTVACELHQALSTSKQPHQQVKQQSILASQASKKVSRVQVFASSQSSVVDAFNKVLSSINPVPIYVPNLSPPTSACITLPSRGFKCLECGDSFALEKSLTQHYERRSVRIEVTCNHCAKNLVFYNKCSLLSHARGHKDKGVVMQCSHLILKPIPTDQMITTSASTGPSNFTPSNPITQAQGSAGQIQGKVAGGGNQNAVISAPCSAPLVAAMPIEDDASKLCRHSLKCLECNEMLQDESSLAMHYQQSLESSGQAIHGTLKTVEGPPNLGINLPLSTKPTNSNSNNSNSPSSNNNNRDGGNVNGQDLGDKKPLPMPIKKTNSSADSKAPPGPGYTCWECDSIHTSREVFVAHMRREHGKILKKHPCRQCDKSFSSSHSLCRHNRLKHKGLRKLYTCPHCPSLSQPFTKRVLLDQHIQLMHGVKDLEGKTISPDNMDAIPDNERSKTLSPKRKQEEDEGSPGLHSRSSDSQLLKKLKVNIVKVHKCAVCGFTTEDISSFHGHIPQHKSDGSSFQCQECGLCYTSHHSLARHLFIVHRLKEPQGLAQRNAQGADDESQRENQLGVTDENDDGTPNTKCKVCGKMFETEGNLNTHMRTHGMAFIKSKRLSTAEK
ncbi:zinc finger protein 532 isoform X3 [Lampris incognitus]|uniref:zinc finger protein 532 isoform X3 n=1 Tax=Lampris incognitus TaxID=2546036 RepID=UPI0024B568F1|nr:zinc finger protein 532 isoform X3 [Lampris incognitus]